MRRALRIGALVLVPVAALLVAADELLAAWGPVVAATAYALGWALWVGGPVVMAICLAALLEDRVLRAALDGSLVLMTLLNLGAALLVAVVPWLALGEAFRFLPFLEYSGLTLLLAGSLLIRRARAEFPKIRSRVTLFRG